MKKRERIKPYLQRLYGYAVSLTRDRDQAEDLVQECALRAITARNTPRDEHAYRAWLFRILRNLFLDRVRHEKVAESAAEDEFLAAETEFWQGEE
ncbi:MAG TPA: RNA polymerase sigma factor, partial [Gammaproteobacteria bacterium]|nr:RNA polymerase sigma factor [Gammaproteobacteria bacterium]